MSQQQNDIKKELQSSNPILAGLVGKNPFLMPEGYLMSVAETITLITNEDKEEKLEQIGENWKVPSNYFEELSGSILARIKAEEQFVEAPEVNLPKHDGLVIPQGYLEGFEDRLSDRIDADITENLMLKEMIDDQAMQVPADYFENLTGRVLANVSAEKDSGTKVVPIDRGSGKVRSILRYVSSAAAILLLFLIGGYLLQQDVAKPFNLDSALASLSEQEISYMADEVLADLGEIEINNLENSTFDIFTFSDFDDQFLEEYLKDVDYNDLNDWL